jgi:hypothetical protein
MSQWSACLVIVACATPVKESDLPRDPVPMGFSDPPHDASVDASGPDTALVDVSVSGPWVTASTCASLERGRAVGCCQPSPTVSLCIVEHSSNHVPGIYAARVVEVRDVASNHMVANFTIELLKHVTMEMPDASLALLHLSVQPWGFELSSPGRCGKYDAPEGARVCANLGKYVWQDGKLAHEPPGPDSGLP